MYRNISSCIKLNNKLSNPLDISIGLRQGCNLSPYLFNLYLNDLSTTLDRAKIDAVTLNKSKVSSLLYADDLLILTRTEKGMQEGLGFIRRLLSKMATSCKHK